MPKKRSFDSNSEITYCAPGNLDESNRTCFTLEQLVEMAQAYNRYVVKNNFSPSRSGVSNHKLIELQRKTLKKQDLLNEFYHLFDHVCGLDQSCWTKQDFMNEIASEFRDEIESSLKPEGPGPTEWLSNMDIDHILKPYENINPDFKYIGAVPSDCDKHSFCSLYGINFDHLFKNYHNIGIVFNLDRVGQPGSHWVAMFITKDGELNYCDSGGKKPNKFIQSIINRFEAYCQKTHKSFNYKWNQRNYQTDSSECGVYSCNFIIRRLAGEDFESVTANSLPFEKINSCRNAYFRNGNSKYVPVAECYAD